MAAAAAEAVEFFVAAGAVAAAAEAAAAEAVEFLLAAGAVAAGGAAAAAYPGDGAAGAKSQEQPARLQI